MWTATIEGKQLAKGNLEVVVGFTNGTDTIGETYSIGSLLELENAIKGRLKRLNDVEALDVPLGAFVVKPDAIPPPTPKQEALNKLREVQDLVGLGVLDKADPKVITAIQEVKDLI